MKHTRELSPAEQVARYQGVIAHVEAGIASHGALAVQAAGVQRDAALRAAEGDPEARRTVTEAAAAENQARAEGRSLAMALEEARKRLAAAEAGVEGERRADLERRAVEVGRVRVEAARRVDAAVAALRTELEMAWRAHAARAMQGGPAELMALKKALDDVVGTAAAGPLSFVHDVQERHRATHDGG